MIYSTIHFVGNCIIFNKNGGNKKIPSRAARHLLLRMKRATFYGALNGASEKRRAIREGLEDSIWSRVKSRKGFWQKVPDELRQRIDWWVRYHHYVIHSLIAKDTPKVTDQLIKGKFIRKSKLILQCSVR